MKKWLGLFVCMVLFGVPGMAQPQRPFAFTEQQTLKFLQQWRAPQVFPHVSPEEVIALQQQHDTVDVCVFAAILQEEEAIRQLSLDQADELVAGLAYTSAENTACLKQIKHFLFQALTRRDLDETMGSFYTLAAASLSHRDIVSGKEIRNWALQQVQHIAQRQSSVEESYWPAVLLLVLAEEADPDQWPVVMSEQERQSFEQQLQKLIKDFDWLQEQITDYMLVDVKSDALWKVSNQGALISLFLQANNFFSYKDDDAFAKALITTGGFKELIRWARNGNMEVAHSLRFSNDGETFYLSHPTPGTDGKGHFVNSSNGRRHYILSQLVQALCVSYATREADASERIEQFVQQYLEVDEEGHFVHYLYAPLQAMRAGRELLENFSLEGWKNNEQALQKQLYTKLKKGYPASVMCTTVQGACEVAFEWSAVGRLFKLMGQGLRLGSKITQKALIKVLPARALLDLAVVDLGAKQALRFSKAGIKNFLSRHGWKAAGIGAAGVGLSTDTSQRRSLAR